MQLGKFVSLEPLQVSIVFFKVSIMMMKKSYFSLPLNDVLFESRFSRLLLHHKKEDDHVSLYHNHEDTGMALFLV